MPRPCKCRKIAYLPGVTFFKPSGLPMRALEETRLSVEEVEAIRLKDLEGLDQEPAAVRMNVSRPTFQRMLSSARRKIADSLLNGKAIRITGGNYELTGRSYRCRNGHEWDVSFESPVEEPPELCPTCKTPEITALLPPGIRPMSGARPAGTAGLTERARRRGFR